MAGDDWRLEWVLPDDEGWLTLRTHLHEHEVAGEARDRLGDRVMVSTDEGRLFAYADTRERALEAATVIGDLLQREGVATGGPPVLTRWHPEEERWADPDEPLPATPTEHAAERERLRADERAASADAGVDEWEVRVELAGHADAVALADRLEGEGLRVVRRWSFVVVTAPSQPDAERLAERIRAETPAGATVEVQGNEGLIWSQLHPFAVFGGLGG